jgi:menaquinone-dependent protoporphyrinogen oxidase
MSRILIWYSTVDGQTRNICRQVQAIAEADGHRVTLADLENHDAFNAAHFDAIVVGASIRYGKHRPVVARYLRANRKVLERRKCAFFSVNVVARKAEKNTPDTNPYMRKLLEEIGWRPPLLAVFAGRLDYPSLGFLDRSAIRFIMLLTRGPTDSKGTFEFTDWRRVGDFAREISLTVL